MRNVHRCFNTATDVIEPARRLRKKSGSKTTFREAVSNSTYLFKKNAPALVAPVRFVLRL